jgi:hypothetical protein
MLSGFSHLTEKQIYGHPLFDGPRAALLNSRPISHRIAIWHADLDHINSCLGKSADYGFRIVQTWVPGSEIDIENPVLLAVE